MKILLSHRYFWPDTSPYGTILRSIAKRLAAEGHEVTVFATQPSYHASSRKNVPARETVDGFDIVRMPIFKERKGKVFLPLRGFNVLAYAAGLRRHILKVGDYDLVTAATFPPIAAARVAVGAAHRTGARFLYHFMDIHPELSLYSGQLKHGALYKRLQAMDAGTCRKADALVVLSRDMAATLNNRPGCENLQPVVINNFFLENFDQIKSADGPGLPEDKFTILFAGNIGKFQNLDAIIKAAHELADLEKVQFWFMGEGAAKERLIKQAGPLLDKTVFFLPFQHHSVAQKLMGEASLNLVSLAPDIYRVAYPSKTLAILAQSSPLLATLETQSELARMVEEGNIGYVADPADPGSIATTVRRAYGEKERLGQLRDNVSNLYQNRFDKDKILDQWCDLVETLAS